MKKIIFWLMIPFLLLISCKSTEKNTENKLLELIENGDVSNDTDKWGLYVNLPGKGMMIAKDEEIYYFVDMIGSENWHLQGFYTGLPFFKGTKYTLSVDMASSIPRIAQIRIQLDSSPYTAYLEKDIELTEDMQNYQFEFVMEEESDKFAKLCFNIGKFEGVSSEAHVIRIDNLSIKADKSTIMKTEKSEDPGIIAINQIGYLPGSVKEVRVNSKAKTFSIKNIADGKIVYTGSFGNPIEDPASGEMVYTGDFSSFSETGEYVIEIQELGDSYTFKIKEGIYTNLSNAVGKMFYYQRCGEELNTKKAGIWAHKACHLEKATVFGTDKKLDVSGGWHDAGDYGRYVSPGAKAVADLFIASNLGSDILDEAKYELDWMLKMQDQETGGVYHKVTTAVFIDSVMPDENSEELILSPISSTATGSFAAIMAKASRMYEKTDPAYSEKTLDAAIKAWGWLENNKNAEGFKNPLGISTGEYGDTEDGDERFWASIELYITTGNEEFHSYAQNSFMGKTWDGLGWADIGSYGTISYIFSNPEIQNPDFLKTLTDSFLESVKKISEKSSRDGYGISLGVDYAWGSNEVVADNAMRLILAEKLTNEKLYLNQAERHLHYLLGSNSLGQSYVSGFGDLSIKNPHHRPTSATGEVIPGMLAGGPNKNLQDPLAKSILAGMAPAKCFIDAEPSYSTNEITIYWNSPLYVILAALQ